MGGGKKRRRGKATLLDDVDGGEPYSDDTSGALGVRTEGIG